MKRGLLQERTDKGARCLNCAHLCDLTDEQFGKCGMRKNKNGEIEVCNYGKAEAVSIDPIEKKPLYHFLPGTKSLSFSASGCSFKCLNCQNWRLSQRKDGQAEGKLISPEEIIKLALENKVKSISYTYGEPIIYLEYALEVMKLAQKEGLKNVWVSNGYFSTQSLQKVAGYIDAVNVDLKSFSDSFYQNVCGGRLKPVLDSIKKLNRLSHLELTTLIIPGYNDSEKDLKGVANFIYDLDPNVAWHISKFSSRPTKDMEAPDTPKEAIEKAYNIGKSIGLNYIYPGNITSRKTSTYCPQCENIIIERESYKTKIHERSSSCSKCGQEINIIH